MGQAQASQAAGCNADNFAFNFVIGWKWDRTIFSDAMKSFLPPSLTENRKTKKKEMCESYRMINIYIFVILFRFGGLGLLQN